MIPLVIFLLFSTPNTFAGPKAKSCRDELRSFKRQGYLVGLLVETERKQTILGFTRLIGPGHEGLARRIASQYGEIVAFKWGGEFLVRNGQILVANETSGMLYRTNDFPTGHQIAILKDILESKAPELIHDSTVFYEHDPEREHLDPQFAKIMLLDQIPGLKPNLRHNLLGTVERAIASIEVLQTFKLREKDPTGSLLQETKETFAATAQIADYVYIENPRMKEVLIDFESFEKLVRRGQLDWWRQIPKLRQAKRDLKLLSAYIGLQLDMENDDIFYLLPLKL